jgi:phage recombination protein Bet
MSEIEITKTQSSIATAFDYSEQEVAVIQNTVAKNTTKVELAYFLNVCKSVQLNPFNKEIWCYKDRKNNLLVFTGRDGFLAKAQQNPLYNGIRSVEVCRKDSVFNIDIPNGKIDHKFDPREDRGDIIGAYAIVFRKDGEPTIEWADFKVYNKGYNTWSTNPAEMIKKVAESHALKKAFGISGIQSEHDFNVNDGKVSAINKNSKKSIEIQEERLRNLFDQKADSIPVEAANRIREILNEKEVNSYYRAIEDLEKV